MTMLADPAKYGHSRSMIEPGAKIEAEINLYDISSQLT